MTARHPCLRGDGRRKRVYLTRERADEGIAETVARMGVQVPMGAYRCPEGHWHIGRQPTRGDAHASKVTMTMFRHELGERAAAHLAQEQLRPIAAISRRGAVIAKRRARLASSL